jgi:phosphonate transport system ATP-binding protein
MLHLTIPVIRAVDRGNGEVNMSALKQSDIFLQIRRKRDAAITYQASGNIFADDSALLADQHLSIDRVSFNRGDQSILRDISLQFSAGTITAIVGPSGVGKTTLIGLLNGLLTPSSGSIFCNGIGSLQQHENLRSHRQQTATIFQDHALIDRLSALDNVLLGLADRRNPLSPWCWPQELRLRAAQALADVELLEYANHPVSRLSGGQRQRVGIARALVRQPRLLLGDEPFAAADPALVLRLGDEFRSLVNRRGITVILVLHQIDIARHLADRIVGLNGGRVAFDGPSQSFDAAAAAKIFSRTLESVQ